MGHEVAECFRGGDGLDVAMGAVADVEDGVALVDGGGERGGRVDGIDVDADEFFEAEEIAFVAAEGSDGDAED